MMEKLLYESGVIKKQKALKKSIFCVVNRKLWLNRKGMVWYLPFLGIFVPKFVKD